ncbi:hypothetical protein D3C73_1215820 [compost metagenome]
MFVLDEDNNMHEIKDDDIICIDRSRPFIYYRTQEGKYRDPVTLSDIKRVRDPNKYIQIDKRKLVNVALADKIEDGFIHFGDLKYPIARERLKGVIELFLDNIGYK